MTADNFIKLCVFLGHEEREIMAEAQKPPFNLTWAQARSQVATAVRDRASLSIADDFEGTIDLIHGRRR